MERERGESPGRHFVFCLNNYRKAVYVVSDRINTCPQFAVSVSLCVLSVFILTALCCDFKHIQQR